METLFYIFCTTVPSHIIPFVLFWNFPWRSRKAALILVCVNVCFKMGFAGYYISHGWNFRNTELAFAVVGFAIYGAFLCMHLFKMLFTYILIVDYLLIVRGIASFIAVRYLHTLSQGIQSSLICILLYVMTLPVLLRFFQRVANQVYRTEAPRLWQTIWLLPALFSMMAVLFTDSYLESSVNSYFFLFCRISLFLCVFVIYHVLLQSLDGFQKQITLEQQMLAEKNMMEMQMEEQKKHSLLIMEMAEQTRQQRHDLRHQLMVIQSLANSNLSELNIYVHSLIAKIPPGINIYCENPTVNAIVSHYDAICTQENISFTVEIVIPMHNRIKDNELCAVFGNLLENAVEACQRMKEGPRFIVLKSSLQYDTLTITMDNSFHGTVKQENGKYYSSKRNGFGVGLSSIRSVARTYQGDASFRHEQKTFFSSVHFKIL